MMSKEENAKSEKELLAEAVEAALKKQLAATRRKAAKIKAEKPQNGFY